MGRILYLWQNIPPRHSPQAVTAVFTHYWIEGLDAIVIPSSDSRAACDSGPDTGF